MAQIKLPFLKTADIAKAIKVSKGRVRQLAAQGRFVSVGKSGIENLYPLDAVAKYTKGKQGRPKSDVPKVLGPKRKVGRPRKTKE